MASICVAGNPARLGFAECLRRAAQLELPYDAVPRPGRGGVSAAVLMAMAFSGDDPHVLVTRRTQTVETHKGQMAFPGGHQEECDSDSVATALREAREEVGLEPDLIQVVGVLPVLETITGFCVTPVLGIVGAELPGIELEPCPKEIDTVVWVPLEQLRRVYRRESLARGGIRYPIDVFEVGPHRIWGVTGTLLKNLLDRIERVG